MDLAMDRPSEGLLDGEQSRACKHVHFSGSAITRYSPGIRLLHSWNTPSNDCDLPNPSSAFAGSRNGMCRVVHQREGAPHSYLVSVMMLTRRRYWTLVP